MLAPISKITRQFEIEPHQLREWEKRGWLGDVLKDPDSNNQRVYTEHQVKRIQLIHETIKKQREKGIKRTDIEEVEHNLLEEFGGEITKRESEVIVHPNTMENMVELIRLQQKMILQLQDQVKEMKEKELPVPVDHSEHLESIRQELKFSAEREEKLIDLIKELQDDVERLKEMPPKSRWRFWK